MRGVACTLVKKNFLRSRFVYVCQLSGILALERDLDILNIVSTPISRLVATQASSSI